MIEVTVGLEFVTACLGNVRRDVGPDLFERDGTGHVTFMNSWWLCVLQYGARALNRHQNRVRDIHMHPHIAGEVKIYRRYYGPAKYKDHEAFLSGDTVVVKAMLPDGMTEADFREILRLAGGYRGISPYGWQDGFGRFTVVEISNTIGKSEGEHETT